MEGSFSIFIFILNLILNFSFLWLPLLLHDEIQKKKAWYHYSMGNKVRVHCNCNTLKKGKENFSMKMKMNKNNIEFFCTLKTVGNTFQPKQNKIQIPKQWDINFLNILCKLSYYQWFVLQILLTWKIRFFIKRMCQISQNLRIFWG